MLNWQYIITRRKSVKEPNKSNSKLIAIGVAIGLLVAVLVFVVWQNFFVDKDDNTDKTTVSQQETTTDPAPEDEPAETADDKKYVVLKDWGVKFDAPTDGTEVEWAAIDNKSVGFKTSNVSGSQDICSAAQGASGGVVRSQNESLKRGADGSPVSNGELVDGYYYSFVFPQGSSCDGVSDQVNTQESRRVRDLLQTLQAV